MMTEFGPAAPVEEPVMPPPAPMIMPPPAQPAPATNTKEAMVKNIFELAAVMKEKKANSGKITGKVCDVWRVACGVWRVPQPLLSPLIWGGVCVCVCVCVCVVGRVVCG